MAEATERELNAWRASAELHQRFLTGLILRAIVFKGAEAGTELNFRTFRAQHLEKFLAGWKSLGLDKLPPAIACAQYIYLANHVGGVKCEFIPENDKKAWVRYLPPRWIWDGAAICAVPNEVSVAFMRGFHSQVGVSLGNPNLGFVCTSITTASTRASKAISSRKIARSPRTSGCASASTKTVRMSTPRNFPMSNGRKSAW